MSTTLDPTQEEMFLGIANALFMNRLHVLPLTEIVRHGIRPNTTLIQVEKWTGVDTWRPAETA